MSRGSRSVLSRGLTVMSRGCRSMVTSGLMGDV
jgi:hypothetical protein